jgi:hypothetical protein
MRAAIVIAFCIVAGLGSSLLQAKPKDEQAKRENARSAKIDELAQKIFTAADRNHDQVLSKREFADAQTRLQTAVAHWGRTRVIGNPKKPRVRAIEREKEKALLASASADVSANTLGKSKQVTEAEFAFYVHAVVDAAEQEWRQLNATADAQARAYNAQRRAMHASRPHYRRTAYPYGY